MYNERDNITPAVSQLFCDKIYVQTTSAMFSLDAILLSR